MSESSSSRQPTTLYELLERSTRAALDLQREDGAFPPGKNGPYDETMTPVRSTARWLVALTRAYEITGDSEFSEGAHRAAEYLLRADNRPRGYTFHARKSETKDSCNQLVGQALPIRSLTYAGRTFDRPEYVETARQVFELHPFHPKLGLWEKVEIDGTKLSFDRTLNHQLLFAGAGSFLAEDFPSIRHQIVTHLDKLKRNLHVRNTGIIRHYVRPPVGVVLQTVLRHPRHSELIRNEVMHHVLAFSDAQRRKEIGYQPLNLFALSWLKLNFPEHSIWSTGGRNWTVTDLFSETFTSRIFDEDIEFGAGQPGISTAIAMKILLESDDGELLRWIQRDLEAMYDPETGLLDDVDSDPMGHAAGVNRVSYLPNLEI